VTRGEENKNFMVTKRKGGQHGQTGERKNAEQKKKRISNASNVKASHQHGFAHEVKNSAPVQKRSTVKQGKRAISPYLRKSMRRKLKAEKGRKRGSFTGGEEGAG